MVGDVQGVGQYQDMNTEGHLKGRTNQYALHWLSGPMKGSALGWISQLPSGCRHQTSAERPNPLCDEAVDSSMGGGSFDGELYTHTYTLTLVQHTTHTYSINYLLRDIMYSIMNQYTQNLSTDTHSSFIMGFTHTSPYGLVHPVL